MRPERDLYTQGKVGHVHWCGWCKFAQRFGYGDVAKMLNERELEAIVNSRIQEEQTKQDPT